jgi:hypothetical protein
MCDAADALCPGCGHPASYVSLSGGFRFRCAPCNWSWGHPQSVRYYDAINALDEAKWAALYCPQSKESECD